jgi:hypothetical protein
MNTRAVIGLLIVVAILAGIVIYVNQTGAGNTAGSSLPGLPTPMPTAELVFPGSPIIERVEIVHQGQRVRFHKDGDNFVVDEPRGGEPDQFRLKGAVAQLTGLRPIRNLPALNDLATVGLALPETTVKIGFAGGREETLLIGSRDPTGNLGFYSKLESSDKVFLLSIAPVTALRALVSDGPFTKPTPTPTVYGPVLPAITPSGTITLGGTAPAPPATPTPAP